MKILFNDGWQFALTEPNSDISAIGGARWYDVELPHDWLISDSSALYKSGCGWYKKSFTLSEKDCGGSVVICFDGVYMDSTVYVNDKTVGEWKNGYTSFSFDISEYVHAGENTVLVRVNYISPNSRWYSGAGIYRNVYLRLAAKNYILTDGVYFNAKAPGAHSGGWRVTIQTELNGDFDGTIKHTLTDGQGRAAADISGPVAGDTHTVRFYIDNPELWDIESPTLYTLTTEIYDADGDLADRAKNKVGFRYIRFDPGSGFYLNSRKVKIKGVCMHHDLGALGAAFNRDAAERQLKMLIDMGANAIRTSHNPPAREVVELCDELGLLVDDEFTDMWEEPKTEYDYARFFPEWYKKDVAAWIRRDRNHPSVIMWSIGNEIHDTHKSERGLEVAKMLCDEIAVHDRYANARPTIGSNYMGWENAQKVADYLKLAGYNYAEKLYRQQHADNPSRCIYGSETASTVRSRGIYHMPYDTAQLTHCDMQCSDLGNSVVNWGASPFYSYAEDRDCRFSAGQFVWTGFDYIGEPTPYSSKNSYFGIIDTAGFAKASYSFYRSVWNNNSEPFIFVMPYWEANEGQAVDVIAYSNLRTLVLYEDDVAHGIRHINPETGTSDGKRLCACWRIKYSRDKVITVCGYRGSKPDGEPTVKRVLRAFGDAESIVLSPENDKIKADGRSLAFIDISAVDKDGREVPNANNRIRVTVSGAGRLVGLDNGDSTDYDSYKGDNRRMFSGKLLAIVQATLDSGEIIVTAEGKGLKSASTVLYSEKCDIPRGISVVLTPPKAEYVPELPVRRIELIDKGNRRLYPKRPERKVRVILHPENADYKDVTFMCCSDSGEVINFAEAADYDGEYVTVRAKGDGDFRLRACCNNGKDAPSVFSDLEYKIRGMGSAVIDAFSLTAATLCNYSDRPQNNIGGGAYGLDGRAVLGFYSMDFGSAGADKLTVYVGNCSPDRLYARLYIGDPEKGGRQVGEFDLKYNNGWDKGYPQEFELPEIIKGINDIYIEIGGGCIFGGISFSPNERAYKLNFAADCDKLYGDDYSVEGKRVCGIGNNVVLEYGGMDFKQGADKLTITGRTPLDQNTIQLRTTGADGAQKTQILEFSHSDEYTSITFDIETLSGVNDISFVFLPGANFDMESFKFE